MVARKWYRKLAARGVRFPVSGRYGAVYGPNVPCDGHPELTMTFREGDQVSLYDLLEQDENSLPSRKKCVRQAVKQILVTYSSYRGNCKILVHPGLEDCTNPGAACAVY